MTAMTYLMLTRLKNSVKAFFSKASNWVALVIVLALMGLVLWSGGMSRTELDTLRPMNEFWGMVMILLMAAFAFSCYQGLGRGTSLFSMADVQLVFPSPVSPRRILFYGLVQKLGTSVLTGVFLLFQYGWLAQYGISFGMLLLVLVLYGASLFMGQLAAMVMYASIRGDGRRRQTMTAGFFAVILLFVGYGLLAAVGSGQQGLAAALTLVEDPVMGLFPVGGWLAAALRLGLAGHWLPCGGYLAATALLAAALVLALARTGSDFYEDVLAATARSHQAVTAKKEGRALEALPEHVKTGHTGLGGGWGASALFYKHRVEARRGRRFLLDTNSLVFAAMVMVFAVIFREEGLLMVFIMATYVQLFSSTTGRWVRELQMPWVYRLPDAPFRRLVWCLGESVLTYALEAVVVMVPVGLICGASLAEIAMAVAARFLLSLLFTTGNLLQDRLFAGVRLRMLQITLYLLMMLILLIPGIVLTVAMFAWGGVVSPDFTLMLGLSAPSVLLVPLGLYLCRGVLDNAEMTT